MHGSVSGFRWFGKIYLMSCLYCKWSLETMDEDQQNWKKKQVNDAHHQSKDRRGNILRGKI